MGLLVVLLTGLLTGGTAYLLSPWMRTVAEADSRWLRSGAHVVVAAVLGVGAAVLAQGWLELVAFAALAAACGLLVVIDLAVHRLPDVIVGPTLLVLLAAFTASAVLGGSWLGLGRAALAAACVGLSFFLLALIAPAGLGLGDVKLAALLGAFLGWQGWSEVLLGTVAAFVVNAVVGALMLAARRATLRSAVAFGPSIVVGAALGAASGAL
jgi:leader peptidase (prepilin peptidase)/N-methyltransferase